MTNLWTCTGSLRSRVSTCGKSSRRRWPSARPGRNRDGPCSTTWRHTSVIIVIIIITICGEAVSSFSTETAARRDQQHSWIGRDRNNKTRCFNRAKNSTGRKKTPLQRARLLLLLFTHYRAAQLKHTQTNRHTAVWRASTIAETKNAWKQYTIGTTSRRPLVTCHTYTHVTIIIIS